MNKVKALSQEEQLALNEFVRRLRLKLDGRLISLVLFGSKARGDSRPDSDIDVLVVVDKDDFEIRQTIRDIAADVWLEYGPYISTRIWSLAHYRKLEKLQSPLYRCIRDEGVELVKESPREG